MIQKDSNFGIEPASGRQRWTINDNLSVLGCFKYFILLIIVSYFSQLQAANDAFEARIEITVERLMPEEVYLKANATYQSFTSFFQDRLNAALAGARTGYSIGVQLTPKPDVEFDSAVLVAPNGDQYPFFSVQASGTDQFYAKLNNDPLSIDGYSFYSDKSDLITQFPNGTYEIRFFPSGASMISDSVILDHGLLKYPDFIDGKVIAEDGADHPVLEWRVGNDGGMHEIRAIPLILGSVFSNKFYDLGKGTIKSTVISNILADSGEFVGIAGMRVSGPGDFEIQVGSDTFFWRVPSLVINDQDGDGVVDEVDNCIGVINGNQDDTNIDGVGDACEEGSQFPPMIGGAQYHIAAGVLHTCVLDDEGVFCWGSNNHGQIDVPVDLKNPVKLVAGLYHTCALDGGVVVCWGLSNFGQSDVPVGLVNVVDLAAGSNHTCAVHESGVSCWGSNTDGQRNVPGTLTAPTQVSAGYAHSCAVDSNGVSCWGNVGDGRLDSPTGLVNPRRVTSGFAHTCVLDDAGVHCWGADSYGQASIPSVLSVPAEIVAGKNHNCALDRLGVGCWARDNYGQSATSAGVVNPSTIGAGDLHSCVIHQKGIACWGRNDFGQGSVPSFQGDLQISTFDENYCVIDDTGVGCWGDNAFGQLSLPEAIGHPEQVGVGDGFVCALTNDSVECWGENDQGQLNAPTNLTSPSHLSTGAQHACVVDSGGVVCWGRNHKGQSTAPLLSGVEKTVTGSRHTCSLGANGVTCWGDNDFNQTSVPELVNPTDLASGAEHSCAIDGGVVVCWGSNDSSQLLAPLDLVEPREIAAGNSHTCVVDQEEVKCWGSNSEGQITVPQGLINPRSLVAGGNNSCVVDDRGAWCWGALALRPLSFGEVWDLDSDGILDGTDNCPGLSNVSQLDTDLDGLGDICDKDDDGDGLTDIDETTIFKTNPLARDTDGDKIDDRYEVLNDLNPLVDDAHLDLDGDNYTNRQEHLVGTSAKDQSDKPFYKELIPSLLPIILN